jgi:hypothetical protein
MGKNAFFHTPEGIKEWFLYVDAPNYRRYSEIVGGRVSALHDLPQMPLPTAQPSVPVAGCSLPSYRIRVYCRYFTVWQAIEDKEHRIRKLYQYIYLQYKQGI